MSFFFQRSKTRTPRLPNENKIIDLTSTDQIHEDLVCQDCGVYMLYFPNHPDASKGYHYVCPKCSQTVSTSEDPIIKRKGSLDIVTNDEAPTISVVDDEPSEVRMSKRMKFGKREERSTDIL